MINYAVIGTSNIAYQYVKASEISGKFSLNAVYSRNNDTGSDFARKCNCDKVYTSLESLACDKDIEAVYIASPNACHMKQTELMLKSGKHVICEKPIATSLDEYKRLKKLADSLGLIYMEAIIPIYVDSREAIKNALCKIGNIKSASLDFSQLTSRYEALMRGEHVNIFDMSLHAGCLMDLGVYCVYAAVDFFGVPKEIKATALYLENGADKSGSAIFSYGDFSVELTYNKLLQATLPSEIVGENGSVIIEKIGLYSGVFSVQNGEKIRLDKDETKENLMSKEALFFAEFIKGKNTEIYNKNSELCFNVHKCMDEIKKNAGILYPQI